MCLGQVMGPPLSCALLKLIEECTFFRNLSRQVVASVDDDYSPLIDCARACVCDA